MGVVGVETGTNMKCETPVGALTAGMFRRTGAANIRVPQIRAGERDRAVKDPSSPRLGGTARQKTHAEPTIQVAGRKLSTVECFKVLVIYTECVRNTLYLLLRFGQPGVTYATRSISRYG